jgi:CheY-like chemotaxis protein/TolB-like protein/Flp pilus assembly protein TadD
MVKEDLSDSRILIVDDVKASIDVLVQGLREEYKLSVATDGESALRIAEKNPPDLVLLDITMPGMDGYEVCRRLRAARQTQDVPVIFLSGLEDVANKALGFEVGGNDYVTKPFQMLEVKARVRSLLRNRLKSATPLPGNTQIAVTPAKPGDWVGKNLGKYQITEVLGQGGMGTVLKAYDPIIERDVAIKVLAPEFAADESARGRFLAEAKAAGKLNHPNVTAIYEIGQEGQTYYLVMEYVAGGSLGDQLAAQEPLPLLEATRMLIEACKGVGAAHAAGLIHRDIKPDNFMRAADGSIKVADFGLAKAAAGTSQHITRTGMIVGTPLFMSPEQCQAKTLDHRSDLYSLGATYYSLLTGKHPYQESDSVTQIMYLHCHGPIPDPRSINPAIPVACYRIIARAMAKAPAERYQSASEMLADLEAVLAGLSGQATIGFAGAAWTGSASRVAPLTARPLLWGAGKGLRDRRIRWAATGLFLVVLGGLVLLLWRPWQKPADGAPAADAGAPPQAVPATKKTADALRVIAVLPFVNTRADPLAEYLRDGIPGALLTKLSDIQQLTVRPYSAGQKKTAGEVDLREIGRQLDTQVVLTGRVDQSRDRLIVHVELVNVDDNRVIWVQQYERLPADLQDIETDIVQRVCARLGLSLSGEREQHLARRDTADPEAHHLYLQGRYYSLLSTLEGMRKSLDCFKQAITKDPKYALAYSGLADAYGYYAGDWMPYEEALPLQKVAARRAIDLDDELAEAHLAMGNVYMVQDFNWSAAEKEFKRAIELKPKLDLAYDAYAQLLAFQGRFDEGLAQQKQALEINPNSPSLIADMSYLFYLQRQYDQAIEQCRKVLEIDPNYVPAHDYLGAAYMGKGLFNEALGEFRKCRKLDNVPWYLAHLAWGQAVAGNQAEARSLLTELKELSKQRYVTPECHFLIYVGLGEKDQAFAWLSRMYEVRSGYPLRLKVQPELDGLRADPRFADWLRRLKLAR